MRLIDEAANSLRACERVRATKPRIARRHLHSASVALAKADSLRGLAFVDLCASGAAECAPGEARLAETAATQAAFASLQMGMRLDFVMEQKEQAVARLAETANRGGDVPPHVTPASRPAQPRRFLLYRSLSAGDRIRALLKRRQRSKAAAPADAPRKLSRGRAPPSLSACSL